MSGLSDAARRAVVGRTIMYAGHDWVEGNCKVKCSLLGKAVADLLGDVFRGIYHLSYRAIERCDWTDEQCICITLDNHMATWDGNDLTKLVVLAHDRLIRVDMKGIGPGYIRYWFHQRKSRTGSTYERMPTIEDHVKLIHGHYGVQDENG